MPTAPTSTRAGRRTTQPTTAPIRFDPNAPFTGPGRTVGTSTSPATTFNSPTTAPTTPTASTTPVPTPPPPPNRDALDYLTQLLTQYGLASLATRAWEQLTSGNLTDDQVIQWMRQQPEHQIRFAANSQRIAAGFTPMSEDNIIGYENQAAQIARMAGAPSGFYDNYSDFANLIGHNVSINEFTSRVQGELVKVLQAPQEVRDAYRDYFGVDGDTALWMTYFDPDKALPVLEQMASSAVVGGMARRYGFDLASPLAQQAAQLGRSQQEAEQGFSDLATQRDYLTATVGESAVGGGDITTEGERAALRLDPQAQQVVARRQEQRKAAFTGSGEALTTERGIIGLGSTR